MPRIKLTAAAVERLKAPDGGQIDHFDAAYPGLALRVSARGVKSWTYFGRVNGKLKRVTLGRWPSLTLPKAREMAGQEADRMKASIDPTAAKRAARREPKDKDTIEAVVAEWLKRDQARNRSKAEVERLMNRDVLSKWRGRRIDTISRRDVVELIDRIADRGAETLARRLHAHLHRMFRWCVARGILETNPMRDLPKPGKEVKRDRVLSDDELKWIWCAAGENGWPFGPAVKLLILTGARRDEIGGLRWSEIDEERSQVRLAGSRTKNNEAHIIPLSDLALRTINELPRISDDTGRSVFVFTTTGSTPVSGWSKAKRLLDVKIEELRQKNSSKIGIDPSSVKPLPAWRFHDLRRTVATGLQRLGFRLEVIEAVLGHVSGSRAGIVGVYQRHGFDDEKQMALDAWTREVETLSVGPPANAVELEWET